MKELMFADCLYVYRKENGNLIYYMFWLAAISLCYIIRGEIGWSIMVLLLTWNSYEIANMNENCGVHTLLYGFPQFRKNYVSVMCLSAFTGNLIFCPIMLIYLLLYCNGSVGHELIFLSVIYCFSNSMGIFLQRYLKKEAYVFLCLALLFLLSLPKTIVLELTLRYFSPVLQFSIMDIFSWINIAGLIAVTFVLFGLILVRYQHYGKKLTVLIIYFILLSGIILTELNTEKTLLAEEEHYILLDDSLTISYKGVSEDYAVKTGKTIDEVLCKIKELGFAFDIKEVHVYRSVYFLWESSGQKIPVKISDNRVEVNCYTDSLCKMENDEIIERAVYSLLDPETDLQFIMSDPLLSELKWEGSGKSYDKFLYENQMIQYSGIVSPKQMLFSEILDKNPDLYHVIYDLAGKYNDFYEFIDYIHEMEILPKDTLHYDAILKTGETV